MTDAEEPTENITEEEEQEEEIFNGRPKTKPGEGLNEAVYEKVRDPVSGRMVSAKPANRAHFAYQKWKAEQAEMVRQKAAGTYVKPVQQPTTLWGKIQTVILLLLGVSMLGRFITGSSVWGHEKAIVKVWEEYIWPPTMKEFTPSRLSAFDGTSPDMPIYLAIDGDVYDVSSSARIYGRGGSYSMLAGKDASRAYVTGCFQPHHLTTDLRGLTAEQLVGLDNWKKFFRNHDRYKRIGKVIGQPKTFGGSPPSDECTKHAPGQGHGAKPVKDEAKVKGKDEL